MPADPTTTAAGRWERVRLWLIRVNNVIRTGGLSLRKQVPRD